MSQPDPRQHDEATAALYEAQAKAGCQVKIEMDRVHQSAGDQHDRYAGDWVMKNSAALDATTPAALARFQAAAREAARLADEINDMDAIYARWGWNRYFLVTNGNGHVHSSTGCSSCYPATQYEWLTGLAAQPIDDMIADWGERACTICFPDAPANPRFREPCKRDREALAAKTAEKAARQAKKDAKNLTGAEAFRVDSSWVETVAACVEVIRHEVELRYYYGSGPHPFHPAYAEGAVTARQVLLAREARHEGHGRTAEQIATILASAEKKHSKYARAGDGR